MNVPAPPIDLAVLYEDNPAMYFIVDRAGTILSVNRVGADHLGYTAGELTGRPFFGIVHEADRERVRGHLSDCVRNPGDTCRWEFRKLCKDGSVVWVRELARAVPQADGGLAVLISCYDATEAKRAEEERERLIEELKRREEELGRVHGSRERLVRGFSHDVKNPLGAADGHLQLLEDGIIGRLDARQEETIRRVRRSIGSALELIETLVDLARAESGRLELQCEPIRVRDVICSAAEEYRAQAEAAGLAMHVNVAAGLPTIDSDGKRVNQILSNLLSNAVKYTERGGLTVTAEIRAREPGPTADPWLAIDVTDTGCGIPPEMQRHLFEEFSRFESDAQGGAGVGLAIGHRLAQLLEGDLTAQSRVGSGSTFTLWLPLRRTARTPHERRSPKKAA